MIDAERGSPPPPWREVEIGRRLRLSAEQRRLLEMHSIYNVLNVLVFRIEGIGRLAGEETSADRLMDTLLAWHAGLGDRGLTLARLREVPRLRDEIAAWVRALEPRVSAAARAELRAQRENLESICEVLGERAEELLRRAAAPDRVETVSVEALRGDLVAALRAIERNAFGRWRLSFAARRPPERSYRIEIEVAARNGRTITLPAVVQDVWRDLTANARKFTDPGGTLRASLREDARRIVLRVEDSGRGIAAEELESVVDFGRRGSIQGVVARPGGGFGLTKALAVARRFGGRMWIRSAVGRGTVVTVELPKSGWARPRTPRRRGVAPRPRAVRRASPAVPRRGRRSGSRRSASAVRA